MHDLFADSKLIRTLQTSPWHAILLSGQRGVGLKRAAESLYTGHDVIIIEPDTTKVTPVISIDTIRPLYEQTRGKTSGHQYVVIHDADTMTKAAQVAFLKLLEEPGDAVRFILTSHHQERLLATVRSRLQQFIIHPMSSEQSEAFINSLGVTDETKRAKLRFMAEGLPDTLEQLIGDEESFVMAANLTTDAKNLITASLYDKLLLVHSYREDRARAQELIAAAINILRKSISQKPSSELITQLERLLAAESRLQANGNVRLTLARLVLQ